MDGGRLRGWGKLTCRYFKLLLAREVQPHQRFPWLDGFSGYGIDYAILAVHPRIVEESGGEDCTVHITETRQ